MTRRQRAYPLQDSHDEPHADAANDRRPRPSTRPGPRSR